MLYLFIAIFWHLDKIGIKKEKSFYQVFSRTSRWQPDSNLRQRGARRPRWPPRPKAAERSRSPSLIGWKNLQLSNLIFWTWISFVFVFESGDICSTFDFESRARCKCHGVSQDHVVPFPYFAAPWWSHSSRPRCLLLQLSSALNI